MEVSQLRRVRSVDCPACHGSEAFLADKNSPTRRFSCPHCHHLWDTTETGHEERARLNRPTTEFRKKHDVSRDIGRDLGRRVARSKVFLGWLAVALAGAGYLEVDAARLTDARATAPHQTVSGPAPASRPAQAAAISDRAVLDQYCVTCHSQKRSTAGLMLDTLDLDRVGDRSDVWENVAHKLRTHEMPPPSAPRPDDVTYAAVAASLEAALDASAASRPNPGRVPVHRLNRAEYANAIRDLLALEVDGRALLPADDADQQGFDNMAGTLSVSPALFERYMSAARNMSRLAVGDPGIVPVFETYKNPKLLAQDDRMDEDLPFGSRGGIAIHHIFPLDGEYVVRVRLRRQLYDYIVGMGEPHRLEVRLDGKLLQQFTVGGEATGRPAPATFAGNMLGDPEWEKYMHEADAGVEVRFPAAAGMHLVGVSFIDAPAEPEGVLQPPQTGFDRATNELYHGNPAVDRPTASKFSSAKPSGSIRTAR
jgi:mono/diheme cytochrome c family protein